MQKRRGWAVIELSAIMIGILMVAAIALLPSSKYFDFGKKAAAQADLVRLGNAISQYKANNEKYPDNLQVLLVATGGNEAYLTSLPSADPWGVTSAGINGTGGTSAYCYARTTQGYAVWSLGPNKANNSGGSGSTLPTSFGGDDVGFLLQ